VIVLAVPGAEIDRCRRTFAFLTAEARQQFPKTHIATLLDQQAYRQKCRAPAAVEFELHCGQSERRCARRKGEGCMAAGYYENT
jgi:hypothetical protein